MIDIPHISTEQLEFTKRVRKYKRICTIPIIGYGNKVSDLIKRGMIKQGVTLYIERPLKFSNLLQIIERLLKPLNKIIEHKKEVSTIESDIELILNHATPPNQKIEAMLRHISSLLAFPFTVAKVLQITQDEKSGAGHLAHTITTDPSISTHLLKVANSVFFASSNRRINSVQDSIVRIGFLETKKIVMCMTIMKLFDSKQQGFGFDKIDFWYHSLAVGLISERVAKHMGDLNIEEAFLAGLLHDIGIIIIQDFFPSIFERILEITVTNNNQFTATMASQLNITQNDLIAGLFPTWKIPQDITDAVTLQEQCGTFSDSLDTQGKKLALCVTIGNILAKSLHIGRECDEFIKPIPDWIFKSVHMPYGIQNDFIDHILQNVEIFRNFLGLEKRDYVSHSEIDKPEEKFIGIANLCETIFIPPAIYFKRENIKYEMIFSHKDLSTYDKKFHLIIAIADETTSTETLMVLKKIVSVNNSSENTNQPVKFSSVLVIGPNSLGTPEMLGEFSFLENQYDLRIFDLKLEELLSEAGSGISNQ